MAEFWQYEAFRFLLGIGITTCCLLIIAGVVFLRSRGFLRRRVKVLSQKQIEDAQRQVAMRAALWSLLTDDVYSLRSKPPAIRPDLGDVYVRAQLRTFLREILDGRGDE